MTSTPHPPLTARLQMLALNRLRSPVRAARAARRRAARMAEPLHRSVARLDGVTNRFRARSEHLSVLDGQTLNLAAVLPGHERAAGAHLEFTSGRERVAALARVVPGPDGRDRVEATVRLRLGRAAEEGSAADGGTDDRGGTAPGEVRLAPGRWDLRLVAVYPERTARVALALPDGAPPDAPPHDGEPPPRTSPAGPLPACPQTRARFGIVRAPSGAAAITVAAPQPTAEVDAVLLRPYRAQITGELLDLPDIHALTADVALRGGGAAHRVRPTLDPGSRGIAFTVDLPVAEMAAVAGGELRWELRFHTPTHGTLRAGRADTDLHRAGAVLRVPARTVRPESGPPALVRPYYTDSGTLCIALTPLPPGA